MLTFIPLILAATAAPVVAPVRSATVTVVARAVILEGQRIRMGASVAQNRILPKPRRGLVEFQ